MAEESSLCLHQQPATGWFKDFVPELRRIIDRGRATADERASRAAQELEAELEGILSDPIYGSGWAGGGDCVIEAP